MVQTFMFGMLAGLVTILLVAALVVVAVSYWRIRRNTKKRGGSGSSFNCGDPSAFDVETATISDFLAITGGTGGTGASLQTGFLNIMSTTIDTCNTTNTLFCDVSAESAMAIVESDNNATGTSVVGTVSGEAGLIEIQVLVDGFVASPGIVTLQNLNHLIVTNLLPGAFRLESLQLANSNNFNFVAQNVPKGSHSIIVQARLSLSATAVNQADSVTASIGTRTLVVTPAFVQPTVTPSVSSSSLPI